MDFNGFNITHENSLMFAKWCNIVGRDDRKEVLDLLFRQITGLPVVSFTLPSGPDSTRSWVGQSGVDTVFLMNHLDNPVNAFKFVTGWNFGRSFDPLDVFNRWCESFATLLVSGMSGQRFTAMRRITCIGHSAGGATAVSLASQLVQAGVETQPVVFTYGSPRSVGANGAARIGSGFSIRWMTAEDPVPSLPPRLVDLIEFNGMADIADVQGWAKLVHVAGGISIDVNGVATPANLPVNRSRVAVLDVAPWLLTQATLAASPHNIAEYVRRLELLVGSPGGGGVPGYTVSPQERPASPTPLEIQRAERQAASAIFNTGARQNADPVTVPAAAAFEAARQGAVWVVYFGEAVVAVGPTKRRARAYAASANAWLRHQQSMAVVDPTTTLQQFGAFYALASEPNSGFVPQLNTSWPSQ